MATIKKSIRFVRQLAAYLQPMQIPLHSAYTSFFLILSLFPSLLLLLGLLRYTDFGSRELLAFLEGMMPQSLMPIAESLISASYRHSSGMVVSVSLIATLWSASRGMYGLLRGLMAVSASQQIPGYWRSRGLSMVYTFLFLLILVPTLTLYMFGNAVVDYLWMTTIPSVMLVMSLVDLRVFLLWLLQSILFTLLYALLPGKSGRVSTYLPGAIMASVGISVFSKLFSLYVLHFSNYTNIYGSIYALALGMLWLYFCICILLYGAALNRWLREKNSG